MASSRKKIIVDEVEAMGHLRTKPLGSDLWSRSASMTRSLRGGTLPPVPEHGLFQPHNVIGSTGGGGTASIYYRSGDTFSHVTTAHDHADNIGRSKVRTIPDYHVGTGASGKSEEFYNGKVRHTSRNPFNSAKSSGEQRSLHGTASAFPNPKTKY